MYTIETRGTERGRATARTTAEVVPYPSTRRVGLIRKLARLMARYSADAGDRTLAARLDVQRTALLRRGLPPNVVEREMRALELAVRAELWAVVMRGGDAA